MCAGGVIAFEVARQLQRSGEQVAMVALIDAADPEATPRAWRAAGQRLQSFSNAFARDERAGAARHALKVLTRVSRKVLNTALYTVGSRIRRAGNRARMGLFRFHGDRGLAPPSFLRGISVRTMYLYAEREYRPGGPFEGELTLFRATRGTGNDEPYVDRYEDPLLGWGPRATRGVRVLDIPGGHSSMLQEPDVEALAERVQSTIDDALDAARGMGRRTGLVSASSAGGRS